MYITTHVSTIFPLAATMPKDFKPRHTRKTENRELDRVASLAVVARPLYETEMEVTRAIADKTFRGFAATAYADAKRYQAYLKAIAKPFFRRKTDNTSAATGAVMIPGYAQK